MPSTAISAQGTKFSIAGTPATALNITAITKSALGAVCSCTTPPVVGAAVVFLTATGMPEIVGVIGIVTSVAAGVSFTVNIDSSGFASAATTSTAAPQTWVEVNNIHDYKGFDGTSADVDKTNLKSKAKEYSAGLQDFGQFTMNVDSDFADAGQMAMRANKATQNSTYFQLIMRTGASRVFNGYVKQFDESGAVDANVKSAVAIKVSGAPSYSEIVS